MFSLSTLMHSQYISNPLAAFSFLLSVSIALPVLFFGTCRSFGISHNISLVFYYTFPFIFLASYPSKTLFTLLTTLVLARILSIDDRKPLALLVLAAPLLYAMYYLRPHVLLSYLLFFVLWFVSILTKRLLRHDFLHNFFHSLFSRSIKPRSLLLLGLILFPFSFLVSAVFLLPYNQVTLLSLSEFSQSSSFLTSLAKNLLESPVTSILGLLLSFVIYFFAPLFNPSYWSSLYFEAITPQELCLMISSLWAIIASLHLFYRIMNSFYSLSLASPRYRFILLLFLCVVFVRVITPFSQHRYVMPYVPLMFYSSFAFHHNKIS